MQTFKKFITEFSSAQPYELGGSLEVNNATLDLTLLFVKD